MEIFPKGVKVGEARIELHPLENPITLATIIGNISRLDDLKSIRLVCKHWRDFTFSRWRETATLNIVSEDSYENGLTFPEFADLLNGIDEGNPNGDIYQLISKPFRRYRIHKSIVLPPYTDRRRINPSQVLFWATCGPHMTNLGIRDCKFRKGRIVEGLKWLLFEVCDGNLTELTIEGSMLVTDIRPQSKSAVSESNLNNTAEGLETLHFGTEFDLDKCIGNDVLRIFPNLKNLKVGGCAHSILESLKTPIAPGTFIQLESLDLDGIETNYVVPSLQDYSIIASPNVKHFGSWIKLKDTRQRPFHFYRLLSSFQSTLTSLELQIYAHESIRSPCMDDFVAHSMSFPNLTNLYLIFISPHTGSPVKFDFRCLSGMPKIKVLRCGASKLRKNSSGSIKKYDIDDHLSFRGTAQEPFFLEHLEDFHFRVYGKLSCKSLKTIKSWAPNIKILETILDKKTATLPFSLWGGLEKVILLPSSDASLKVRKMIKNTVSSYGSKKVEVSFVNDVYYDSDDFVKGVYGATLRTV